MLALKADGRRKEAQEIIAIVEENMTESETFEDPFLPCLPI